MKPIGTLSCMGSTLPSCPEQIKTFLAAPNEHILIALSRSGETDCWAVIESSNVNLNQLIHSVANGNQWAAQYLATHLKRLDGGNLEDSLIALGQFSDHDMERLLNFAKNRDISNHELTDALTMLPLSLNDNPHAQLDLLRSRRSRVILVTQEDLYEKRALTLKSIDDFVSKIIKNELNEDEGSKMKQLKGLED